VKGAKKPTSGEKSLECPCGKSFVRPKMFARHRIVCSKALAAARPEPPPAMAAAAAANGASTRVQCLDCGERFPDAKALGIHRSRTHFA
jgi:hypothetical protein